MEALKAATGYVMSMQVGGSGPTEGGLQLSLVNATDGPFHAIPVVKPEHDWECGLATFGAFVTMSSSAFTSHTKLKVAYQWTEIPGSAARFIIHTIDFDWGLLREGDRQS